MGDVIESLGDAFHDGFMRGAGRLTDVTSDSEHDAWLLRQLGMTLGLVYAAFLCVWFWATRVRWQVRD